MQFTATVAPKGKHVYLEIGDVHDYAHVTLNGKEVGARSFQPYRWDVTGALKKGTNDLKIEVYANVAQARPAAAPPAAAGGGGRGGPAAPATSGLLGPVKLVAY
jgi:beta-galactosidase/beta-glucuronidase